MKRTELARLYRFANFPLADARPGWLRHFGLQSLMGRADWRSIVQSDPVASDVFRRIGPRFDWDHADNPGVDGLIRLSSRQLSIAADALGRVMLLATSLCHDRTQAGRRLNSLRSMHPQLRLPVSIDEWFDGDSFAPRQPGGTIAHGCGWLQSWLDHRSPTLWPRLRLRLPPSAAIAPASMTAVPTRDIPPLLQAVLEVACLTRHGKD